MSVLTIADIDTAVSAEPRIMDLRLAEALGFDDKHKIRPLADRHIEALQRFGEVSATVAETTARGGRPGKTYWLNLRQALYLATKSEAENAVDLTVEMVDLFASVREGKQISATATETVSLDRSHLSMLRLGGKVVLVDTRKFKVNPDDRVVRIHPDGRIDVGKVQVQRDARHGVRGYFEKYRKYRKGDPACVKRAIGTADLVHVLGLVIDEIPAGRPVLPKPQSKGSALTTDRSKFDAAAFVEDLNAAGCDVGLLTPVLTPGYGIGSPSYVIRAPEGCRTSDVTNSVLKRWSGAIKACPNHQVKVAAYLVASSRAASSKLALTRH